MWVEDLSAREQALYQMLFIPAPDYEAIAKKVVECSYTSDEITRATIGYLSNCVYEELDYDDEVYPDYDADERFFVNRPAVIDTQLCSANVYNIIKLLLQYGLDPNASYEGFTVANELKSIANEYLAADALQLLFENGMKCEVGEYGNQVFWDLDFDVMFDISEMWNRRRYDAAVHCWFVFLGNGGASPSGKQLTEVADGFDLSELKNHRNFFFGLSQDEHALNGWWLHIFDKQTLWEVGRL